MKKSYLLLIVLFITIAATAQSNITFGIRAGGIQANLAGQTIGSLQGLTDLTSGMVATRSHSGFFGGGYASIPLTERLSIEPGLYYSQKGYVLQGSLKNKVTDLLGINAKAQLNMNYIDLPVLAKVNFNGFQVFAGPQVSYLTNASVRTTAGALGFNVLNSKTDATNQFSRWDMALTGGAGYQFAGGFNITASYDYGLMKADAHQNASIYNRAVKLGIGYAF